ncbi:metallophosphoesterase family protein [Carboxydothermus ferrireducens]|uniref:Phosphoesterase n=1 Tax=Carboxydothermus ferrireducens DSM 11255 TaxID=1119529 RepID=A0ABX2R5H1_9THEO|nr:YfcE family phosphodiesterase [Carboxydothermus ferrireducens]NYE56414.1 putative phosphoesterase [Carboxydothermus ferrireducens DSM 11255]
MLLAFIGDIHGNLPALKEVLADAEMNKVEKIYHTGDLIGYGPYPNEVVELIRDKNIEGVLGNYDDGAANNKPTCGCDYKTAKEHEIGAKSLAFTAKSLLPENREYLKNLPNTIKFVIHGKNFLLFHGSPERLNEYLTPDLFPGRFNKLIEDYPDIDVFVFGHTHYPFYFLHRGRHFLNPGSLGKPKTKDPRAVYAQVEVTYDKLTVNFRPIPYPYDITAAAIRKKGLPEELAQIVSGNIPF